MTKQELRNKIKEIKFSSEYLKYSDEIIFNKLNNERFILGMSIIGLLIISILDCHFFNMGPGFIYGALLLFVEIDYLKTKGLV